MKNMYALINIARNELNIEEEDYRAMVMRINGNNGQSLKDCSTTQLRTLLNELKAKGFSIKQNKQVAENERSKPHTSSIHNKLLSMWI